VAAEEAAEAAAAATTTEAGAEAKDNLDVDLDEIERVDDSIFAVAGDDFKPIEPVPPPPPAASESEATDEASDSAAADEGTEETADAALAADEDATTASGDAGADGRAMDEAAVGDDAATLFSFRAMAEATNAADSSVSEAADQTHKIARNYLKRSASADELFGEINREQQIFMAKRALVARQRATIADSIDSLKRLKSIVGENKKILSRNERALKRASDDLLRLITSYQSKLKDNVNKELGIKPAPAVASFPLIPPATKLAAKRKPSAPRKMRFAEAEAESVDETEDEAEDETAAESDSEGWEEESEANSEEGSEETSEEGSEEVSEESAEADESESGAAAEDSEWEWEETSDESADASAADESADAESESESSLVETESYDPTSPRVSVLPGLSAPPPLYNPASDEGLI